MQQPKDDIYCRKYVKYTNTHTVRKKTKEKKIDIHIGVHSFELYTKKYDSDIFVCECTYSILSADLPRQLVPS